MQSRPNPPAHGRPREIEAWTNLRLVHPLSRAVVDRLAMTAVTPNQVSVASILFAAAGALCYLTLSWPWAAIGGLFFQFGWHVLDGADGDLARRTGRASALGELIDGVCDHVSQGLVYVALAILLQRSLGPWAWAVAWIAALSHFIQANAYETGRKTYRRWVYGAPWMRQTAAHAFGQGVVQTALAQLYVGISGLSAPGETRVEAAMLPALAGQEAMQAETRAIYRNIYAPLVKASGWLDSNTRTLAAFASLLMGNALWFFLFEIVGLNLALAYFTLERRRCDARLIDALDGRVQAASAPN